MRVRHLVTGASLQLAFEMSDRSDVFNMEALESCDTYFKLLRPGPPAAKRTVASENTAGWSKLYLPDSFQLQAPSALIDSAVLLSCHGFATACAP
jgi:hypothetical protein